MLRLRASGVSSFALACVLALGSPEVGATPGDDRAAAPSAGAKPADGNSSGFEILALGGFGKATADVANLEMQPYGASAGLDVGYEFRSRFRLGANVVYGFGRAVTQRHEARVGEDFDLTADASSLNVGTSLGYDVPLFFLELRYSVAFGATFMRWDLGGARPEAVFDQVTANSPSSGFFFAPGLSVLWPHDLLLCGVGFDYFVQANGAIPPGMWGKILVGVKL